MTKFLLGFTMFMFWASYGFSIGVLIAAAMVR